jgi:anti-sigma regulatory factor (Ser/Thr protein kinase)
MKTFDLKYKVTIENDAVFEVIEAIQLELEPYELPFELSLKLHLALEELLLNLVHHTTLTEEDTATVTLEKSNDLLTMTIIDSSAEFNPLTVTEPDLSLDLEDRPIGGLGIHLIKQNTESVSYQRSNDQNILQLVWKHEFD